MKTNTDGFPAAFRRASRAWRLLFAATLLALAPALTRAADPAGPSVPPRPAPANSASMDALDDRQKLTIGDRISFRILEDKDEPKPLTISDTGELEVPYIGRVSAADKSCLALAREIKTALEKKYYYRATVIVAVDFFGKNRGKIYLVGQVRTSGPQDIPNDEAMTLTKTILRAGGFTDFADKKHVKVTRKRATGLEAESFTVDVSEIIEKGRLDKDVVLQSGDLVFVPARLVSF